MQKIFKYTNCYKILFMKKIFTLLSFFMLAFVGSAVAQESGSLTLDRENVCFWGFTPATESYYNTHSIKFHVTAENLTENITYVMASSGKAKGSTSPRITVATAGLYEANSGDLKLTCNTSKLCDIKDTVIIKSGDVEVRLPVSVVVANTQYNGEGIFDEEWDECRPFTVADLNAIHAIMPQNSTYGTDPTHEFSMYYPKLRYFQGVVAEVSDNAADKASFTIVDEEGDAPAVMVLDAKYKEGQDALKAGDKVVLSGDFADVEGELQLIGCDIESIDVSTSISNIATSGNENIIYNISGMRVQAPTKGLYIINGKKVVVK